MSTDLSTGLLFATALAVLSMLVVWGLPMGAISISRSISEMRARRQRKLRRNAFHVRMRKQTHGVLARASTESRDSRRAT